MKIAVLGAGAMGSLFGARLALAGEEVSLIDVSEEQISAITSHGVTVTSAAGTDTVRLPIGRAEAFGETADLVLVFTKGPDTLDALRSTAHLLGAETRVLSLQNGLGNGERIAQIVEPDRVLIGVTDWPALRQGPGAVLSQGSGSVRLWSLRPDANPRLADIGDAFNRADLNCRLDPDVNAAIWEKAAFNAAMNAVAGLTGFTVGQMADSPDVRAVQDAVVVETVRAAEARGVAVQADRIHATLENARQAHRAHRPSMLQDLLAGRPTEIETINMAIVEEAQAAGETAPVVETLGRLIRAMESRPDRSWLAAPR